MGGSAKPPKQSDQSRKSEALQIKLLEQQLADAKRPLDFPEIKIPKPPPPPAPPQQGEDVAAASLEARRRAMRRTNAGRGTLFAGETGGQKPATLLGGGKY